MSAEDDFAEFVTAEEKEKRARRGYAPENDLVHELPQGLVLAGTSLRYNQAGEVEQYWNKSKPEGRSPADAVQLPDPKTIAKVSTLYDQEGRVTQQWVQEKPEAVAVLASWNEAAKALASTMPRAEPVEAPGGLLATDMMACYPVGDHHLGMLSWAEETGADYDLKISEALLRQSFDYLLGASPACERAVVAFLGDLLHYDGWKPVTPTGGNQLDADSRFPKMVKTAMRSIRYAIEATARKHGNVHVIVEIGNHDLSSSIFLMESLANIYENDPRITVDTSPKHFHYIEFGKNLIGTHHGHGVKPDKLPLVMASDRSEAWGRTKHRYWWTGHVHHESAKDFTGCKVESFRILAPADAWASQMGYRSARGMKSIILHSEHGEVARNTVNPDMFS
jgi:hypothetical protein